jgi:hypothetical protein
MSVLEEGNIFQQELFNDELLWNSQIGRSYPSLKVNGIKRFQSLKEAIEHFALPMENIKVYKQLAQALKNQKELLEKLKKLRASIEHQFKPGEKYILLGDNKRGDIELNIYNADFKLEEFKAFLVYKCPIYLKYSQLKPLNKLAIDGLLVEVKQTTDGNYSYEIRILEAKLSDTIWPSYIAQSLIYWINLNEFLKRENLSSFFKLKKEILFVLGRKQSNSYGLDIYIFPFEDAIFRLKNLKNILQEDFKNLKPNITPPIKALCFQGEKCKFLNTCFSEIMGGNE